MKPFAAGLSFLLLLAGAARADIQTDWAYHSLGDGDRLTTAVPGESFFFLANGTDQIGNDQNITLYVLTASDFAGPMDEQIYVRWWDGAMAHWVMGGWVKNVVLDAAAGPRFKGQPAQGTIMLDLWKIEIPEWVTQPGENFYAIQLKGFAEGGADERYLLSKPGGDFAHSNNLGQIWSSSEEFDGQDWKVDILP